MRSVLRVISASMSPLAGALLAALVLTSPAALAQQQVVDPSLCAEDVSNIGNCTANEVSLSGVTNISVTDINDNLLTECTEGTVIKLATLTADLDSNTGTRYDITFWAGKFGNDPRISTGVESCIALSLPTDTGSSFIDHFEGADNDNCLDFAQPDVPIALNFGGNDTELTCSDSNNDGFADIQVVTTWWQNTTFDCGVGDPLLSPGSPSKCDFTIIELVPIVTAGMSLTKSVLDVDGAGPGGSVDAAGDVITYQLLIENVDTATLTNVEAGDPLFEGFDQSVDCTPSLPTSLAQGESATCTGTYTATQADIDSNGGGDGDIDNQAFASSNEVGIINDTAEVPIVQNATKSITKTATDVDSAGDGVINNAGEEIDYEIVVTNTGNTTLTNVDVTDDLISLTCNPVVPVASLAPGATITCTGTYVVTQGDIDGGGPIDNEATATSNEAATVMDTESVPVSQTSTKSITKTATDVDSAGDGVINNAGEEIDYEIVVTNTGNTTLTNVDVTDDLISLTCNPVVPVASLAPERPSPVPAPTW